MSDRPTPQATRSAGLELPRPVAFVLGGGASFGAVQVGMLQALGEVGLSPDLVVGTSVGAANGALLAEDPRGAANRLSHRWLQVRRQTVFPAHALQRVRSWRRNRTYLVSSAGLRELLDEVLATERFEDLTLPLVATAVDLASGEVVYLDSGPLAPAIMASTAVPGIYPAVHHDGRELVDGGVVANVPIERALALGAASVVVLDCGVFGLQAAPPRRLGDTVAHALAIMLRQQVVKDVPPVARQIPVLYLPGPFPVTASPLEFGASARLMQEAYEKSRAFLAAVEPDGPGLYGHPPMVPGVEGTEEMREVRR
ncbi:MAG: patatin-like phospholipase family protein [Solirubrobacterales bacterium]